MTAECKLNFRFVQTASWKVVMYFYICSACLWLCSYTIHTPHAVPLSNQQRFSTEGWQCSWMGI